MSDTQGSSDQANQQASLSSSPSPHTSGNQPTPHTHAHHKEHTKESKAVPTTPKKPLSERAWHFYHTEYKKLLIIPFVFMFLFLAIIGFHYVQTGEFITKDVSLKGGATITIPLENEVDALALEHTLNTALAGKEIAVREFGIPGQQQGIIISADLDINNREDLDNLIKATSTALTMDLSGIDLGVESFSSALGSSFFRESLLIMLIAFGLMGLIVFAYFRTFVPSIAIILKAVSVMLGAVAFLDLFHIPIGTAGIAAFLMLIGYSVDTDILLTIRVLKRKEGSLEERIEGSIKTGLTITLIAVLAMAIGFAMAQSDVIRQIMLILMVGLAADPLFTWIQNVGMLRYYLEKKGRSP